MIGDRKPRVYLKTVFNENHAVISPDGRWLAYTSDETGRPEVYVRTFPDPNQGKWQISTRGAIKHVGGVMEKNCISWHQIKDLLLFRLSRRKLKPGSQAVLFRAPVGYNNQNRDRNQYLPSADGQRF